MLDEKIYKNRMEKVREFLREINADFALLTPSPAFQYLTGIKYTMRERLVAALVRSSSDPVIISPAFEASEHACHTWVKDILSWVEDEDPYSLIAQIIMPNEGGHIAVFDKDLPLGVYWSLEKALGGYKKIKSMTPLIEKMRLIKNEEEIEIMKKAGHIINEAVMKAFKDAELGITELEMRQRVHNEIVRQGALPTFAAVQFGENSALPHAEAGTRQLNEGDMVLLDCGCEIEGYNTDMTRVGVAGEPTDEQEQVYSIVLKAQEEAIEKIQPGMSCGAADGVARKIIEQAGHGDYFTHRLGHGIGIEVHEPPYLVRGNSELLQNGMTHSIEPGIYLAGKFGIRIEDLVVVREDGVEVITYSPKDMYIITA